MNKLVLTLGLLLPLVLSACSNFEAEWDRRLHTKALDGFDGKQLDLVGYLATEVYLSLPDEIRSFFLLSSILDNFNAQVCDYVLQRQDSAQILKKLINRSMFIMPLPEKNHWYRYHDVSEFLFHQSLVGIAQ